MTVALVVVAFGLSSLTLSGSTPHAQSSSAALAEHR
jgi:hypothetical protein